MFVLIQQPLTVARGVARRLYGLESWIDPISPEEMGYFFIKRTKAKLRGTAEEQVESFESGGKSFMNPGASQGFVE